MRDYQAWHRQYDDPDSAVSQRLGVVQRRLRELLDAAPPGPIRVISICAGEGRDLLGVLPDHPRRADVSAVLVEIDHSIAGLARIAATVAGLTQIEVLEADAAVSDVYAPYIPADLVLACGIFGNISITDLERTVRNLSMLGHPGTAVIWTRHRQEPDLTPAIRRWFVESGFQELSFDGLENESKSGIGVVRLAGDPVPFTSGIQFFTFVR
jgi:hypothetical protein